MTDHECCGERFASRSKQEVKVWLVRDADDRRALHDYIAIERGEETRYFELSGWEPQSPIELIMGVAVTGGAGSGVKVVQCEPDSPPVKLKGFVAMDVDDLPEMLERALTGGLGGFHAVAVGLTGYHSAPMAFEYLHSAAGSPRVLTCHPDIVEGAEANLGGPTGIGDAADVSLSMAAIRAIATLA